MGVQADQALAGLDALFDAPAPACDPDQDSQRTMKITIYGWSIRQLQGIPGID